MNLLCIKSRAAPEQLTEPAGTLAHFGVVFFHYAANILTSFGKGGHTFEAGDGGRTGVVGREGQATVAFVAVEQQS